MNKVVVNGVDCSPGVVAELRSRLAAAESRAERLEKALAPFIVPESYSTAEEACRRNAAMDWCAVHSFRWPCPVTAARAALAEHRDAKTAAPEGEKEGERG